jgi:hypothetical protein
MTSLLKSASILPTLNVTEPASIIHPAKINVTDVISASQN